MSSAGNKADLTVRIVPFLIRSMMRGICASMRIDKMGTEILDRVEEQGQAAVLVFFHDRQFLLAYSLIGRKLGALTSLSRDGEMQARLLQGFGFSVVRGSSSRGGARGLIGLLRLLEDGYHATVAVDGPRGPRYRVKPGAVYVAKKSGCPLVLMTASASPAKVLKKAWDRFLLPWPFGRGVVVFDGPFPLDGDMTEQGVERDRRRVEEAMLELQRRADELVGREFFDEREATDDRPDRDL